MAETKSRILYILKYLWQNTDVEHYATTGDILTYLKENGISCDRKTIPGDIAKLCDIGIDIEEERSRENRYSLSSHLFTLPEVTHLITREMTSCMRMTLPKMRMNILLIVDSLMRMETVLFKIRRIMVDFIPIG